MIAALSVNYYLVLGALLFTIGAVGLLALALVIFV